jgi:hypothetical protein
VGGRGAAQDFVVAQQAREELEQRRAYPQCRRRYTTKDSGSTPVSTVFGRVEVPNPQWNRCGCQTKGPQTFRPMRTWLKWANQPRNAISGDEVGVSDALRIHQITDRQHFLQQIRRSYKHLQLTAERIEQELVRSANSIGSRARNRSGNDSLYQMVRSRWVSTAVTLRGA